MIWAFSHIFGNTHIVISPKGREVGWCFFLRPKVEVEGFQKTNVAPIFIQSCLQQKVYMFKFLCGLGTQHNKK